MSDLELTAADQADLNRLYTEPDGVVVDYHTILEVWREVLKPAVTELTARITPQWASRIIASYPQISYGDMVGFRDRYFTKLISMLDMLLVEISWDKDCLTHLEPKTDVTENAHHYLNLLLGWQMLVLQWEMDWDTGHPDAAIELAAISEVHKMFFGPTGMTAYLDSVSFEFTDDDSANLQELLEEFKEGTGE